jgi:hypothetical protein
MKITVCTDPMALLFRRIDQYGAIAAETKAKDQKISD